MESAQSEFERLAPRLYLAHKQEKLSIEATGAAYILADAYRSGDTLEIFYAQMYLLSYIREIKRVFGVD